MFSALWFTCYIAQLVSPKHPGCFPAMKPSLKEPSQMILALQKTGVTKIKRVFNWHIILNFARSLQILLCLHAKEDIRGSKVLTSQPAHFYFFLVPERTKTLGMRLKINLAITHRVGGGGVKTVWNITTWARGSSAFWNFWRQAGFRLRYYKWSSMIITDIFWNRRPWTCPQWGSDCLLITCICEMF